MREHCPFVTLGLHSKTATVDEVNASFRRLALACHPDKNPDNENAAEDFARLKNARDEAMTSVLSRDGNYKGQQNASDERDDSSSPALADPMVAWAVSWMHKVTYEIAKTREAKPVEVDLEVSLEDVYHARTKKVVLSVLRADSGEPFKRTRQTVYVHLLPSLKPDGSTTSLDATFPGMGDDPPLAILMGFDAWKDMVDVETLPTRSDVIVRVHVRDHDIFKIDSVLRAHDLHTEVSVSLEGRYLGEKFELEHPSGIPVVVEYEPGSEEGEDRQVRVIKGMGLPYATESGSGSGSGIGNSGRARGDLFVFMEPRLPKTLDLDKPGVREALRLLDPIGAKE